MQTFSVAIFYSFFIILISCKSRNKTCRYSIGKSSRFLYLVLEGPPWGAGKLVSFPVSTFLVSKKNGGLNRQLHHQEDHQEKMCIVELYFYTCLGWKYFLPPHKVNRTCDWQDLCNGNSSDHAADTIVELRGIDLKPDFKKWQFLIPSLQ